MKRILSALLLINSLFLITSCGKDETKNTNTQGKEMAILSFSHSPKYDFGIHVIDSIVEKEFTVTNIGFLVATQMTGSFYLSLSFNYKGGNYPGEGGTCTDLLPAHKSCTLVVVFTPKVSGPVQTSLILNYNNGITDTTGNGPTLAGNGN